MSEEDLVQVRKLLKHLEEAGIDDPVGWIEAHKNAPENHPRNRWPLRTARAAGESQRR